VAQFDLEQTTLRIDLIRQAEHAGHRVHGGIHRHVRHAFGRQLLRQFEGDGLHVSSKRDAGFDAQCRRVDEYVRALGTAEPHTHRRFGQFELRGEELHKRTGPQQCSIQIALGIDVEVKRGQVRKGSLTDVLLAHLSPTRRSGHLDRRGEALHTSERHLPRPGSLSRELGLKVVSSRTKPPCPPSAATVERAVASIREDHSVSPMSSINARRTTSRTPPSDWASERSCSCSCRKASISSADWIESRTRPCNCPGDSASSS